VKRFALLLSLFIAAFAASCGGGGSSVTPPPPVGGFSNSSLKGQYAFIMTGQAPDGFIARIGSITADGNGGITGGLELVSTASKGLQPLSFSPSTYTVQADGRGVINLTNITGTISFSITLTSTTAGYICQTDGITGTSGTLTLQDTSAFTTAGVNGPFAFNASGLDPNGNVDSIVGQFALNAGTIPTGVFDENDDTTLSGPTAITSGTYLLDATNGPTVGLGQMSFGGFVYDFIIVNSKKIHLIEVPAPNSSLPVTVGTANGQTAPPTSNANFTGSFVFMTSGVGTQSPDFKVGRFASDGNGNLASIALDEKQLGSTIAQVPKGSISAAKYSIDTSNAGTGRGIATFTDSSLGTYSFIFYMTNATTGVIQDNSKGLIADGVILAQTGGPFSNSSVAGKYAFNWNGTSTNTTTNVTAEEDFVGQVAVTSASSNNVTGAMDFSELNSNQGAFHNSVLSGNLTINGDGTTSSGNRSTTAITAAGTSGNPSTTFTFTLYPVNSSTMFVVSQDKDHVTGGTFTMQVTPP